MGNCLARKAVVLAKENVKKNEQIREEESRKSLRSLQTTKQGKQGKQRKTVRFKLDEGEEEEEERRKEVVRIKLVVTRAELRQILNGEAGISMKLGSGSIKTRRIHHNGDDNYKDDDEAFSTSGGDIRYGFKKMIQRPVLDSIPEL